MAALWMQLRSDFRRSMRAMISIVLMTAVVAGASMAAAAGARRTATAYPRFVEEHDGYDALTGGGHDEGTYAQRVEAIKNLPEVEDSVTIVLVGAEVVIPARRGREQRTLTFQDVFVAADPEGRSHYETNRAKMLQGRLPDRSSITDASVPFTLAQRQDIRIGDTLMVGVGFEPETFAPIKRVPMRVVGLHAAPGEFEAVGQVSFLSVIVTPAFLEEYREIIPPLNPETWNLAVHLRDGPDAATRFKQKVEVNFGLDVPFTEPVTIKGVQKSMRLYSSALWLLALLIALAGVAVIGQTLARQVALDASDYPVLRALGFSRRGLVLLALVRGLIVGSAAAVLAVVMAVALSPLTPIGAARIAEPNPGVKVDLLVVGIGVVAMLLLVSVITVVPGWRAARAAGLARVTESHQRPSRIVGLATGLSGSPAIVSGLRLALEPGRGATAVPVRSTIAAVAFAIAAVVGTFFMGASMDHLLETPDLSGYTYDAIVPSDGPDDVNAKRLQEFDFVADVSPGTGMNSIFEGVDSFVVAFDESTKIRFAIISGRAPRGTLHDGIPEIALGPATIRRMGVEHGDVITFFRPREDETTADERIQQKARVVGTAAVPALPWMATEPGEGGVMTAAAVLAIAPEDGVGCCYVRFKEGTDLDRARKTLEAAGLEAFLRTKRSDLRTLEQIAALPLVLSALFALMALAALVHVLTTGIRRRRRDLAVLKTLGFVRRQVRSAVAWQAGVTAVLCAVVGIPLGAVLGRIGWRAVAGTFGVVPAVKTPVLVLLLVAPLALLVARIVAVVPARIAARTQPAVVLRIE